MKKLIISPTYNEGKNIREFIGQLTASAEDADILIIDDNSPDGTGEIVKELAKNNTKINLLEREGKLGLGTAYCCGFKWALEKGYEFIVQMDADLSHNPEDVKRMFSTAINGADVVVGSRYIVGVNVVNWPMRRLILSYLANWYSRFIIRFPITDSTGGFKCFQSKVLQAINLDSINSEGYSFQIEMNFLAWIKGFNIKEIPIVFTDRTVGESKMNRGIVIEAIWMVPKLLLRKIFRNY